MDERPKPARLLALYLCLGLTQTAHSIEEMHAHLYEFFAVVGKRVGIPVSAMSPDLFAMLNFAIGGFFLFSLWGLAVRKRWAVAVATIAAVIETLNGILHLSGAAVFRGYVPGAATAPFLILFGLSVLRTIFSQPRRGTDTDD
ncbi:MAG: HXXEE domain-containing protein [Acidobacteriota bacterium]|nr:HXXEE domain-containing protein [Acidobacteriota bacterium]